jgi:uncharacterized membrane protein
MSCNPTDPGARRDDLGRAVRDLPPLSDAIEPAPHWGRPGHANLWFALAALVLLMSIPLALAVERDAILIAVVFGVSAFWAAVLVLMGLIVRGKHRQWQRARAAEARRRRGEPIDPH